ncbi:oxygenase MpaB family protein [Dactylosporangium sp. CA-139114]|uniref:oxygenase MpaB family protein n=1 Tax=Dactylosporangium sp. CA-139114 TaxID=3239931 RepID=UPI003D980095
MLHRPNRFKRLAELQRLDPVADADEIYRITARHEFPFDHRLGLLLAFWRTFAVPSIAETLHGTGKTTEQPAQRARDTGRLMYELIDHGLDHPRGRAATRELNRIHRQFAISNEDYLYVLGTFIVIVPRWIDRHGWRPLCCHERAAIFHFYTKLGRRMNIVGIPRTIEAYEHYFDTFERDRFAPSVAATELMAATKGLVAKLPRPIRPLGRHLTNALLDPALAQATGTPRPAWWARKLLHCVLRTRARLLRHAGSPS